MAISYSVPETQISQITLLRVVRLSYLGPEIVSKTRAYIFASPKGHGDMCFPLIITAKSAHFRLMNVAAAGRLGFEKTGRRIRWSVMPTS